MSVGRADKCKKNLHICLIVVTGCLVAAWMAVIFWFSAQPAEESSDLSGTVAYHIVYTADQVFDREQTQEELLQKAEILNKPLRKMAHMTEYAILAVLSMAFFAQFKNARNQGRCVSQMKAVRNRGGRVSQPDDNGNAAKTRRGFLCTWRCIAALILSFCYASTDEFHQLFVEGRSSQFTDVLIDTAGAATGLMILIAICRICRVVSRKCRS